MTRPYSQTLIQSSWVLQSKSLKLKSHKFNIIIINIINITLGSRVAVRPKVFRYIFVERPKTLSS
jgi:hypothetical protein